MLVDQTGRVLTIVTKQVSKLYLAKKTEPSKEPCPVELMNDVFLSTPQICSDLTFSQLAELKTHLEKLIQQGELEVSQYVKNRDIKLKLIGNLVHEHSPISNSSKYDKIIKTFDAKSIEPSSLIMEIPLKLLDFDWGMRIMENSSSSYMEGNLIKLQQALISYCTKVSTSKGYESLLIQTDTKFKENPKRELEIMQYDQKMISSSLNSVLTKFQGERVEDLNLPKMFCTIFTGFTSKDKEIHQNQIIEHVILCSPKPNEETNRLHSEELFLKQVRVLEEFYELLGFSYQITNVVTGSLEKSAIKTFQFKIFSKTKNEFVAIAEVSSHTDYLSREYDIIHGKHSLRTKGVRNQFLHVISCRVFTHSQVLKVLIENNTFDGKFHVPEILIHHYNQ